VVKQGNWSNKESGQKSEVVKQWKWSNKGSGQTKRLSAQRAAAHVLRSRRSCLDSLLYRIVSPFFLAHTHTRAHTTHTHTHKHRHTQAHKHTHARARAHTHTHTHSRLGRLPGASPRPRRVPRPAPLRRPAPELQRPPQRAADWPGAGPPPARLGRCDRGVGPGRLPARPAHAAAGPGRDRTRSGLMGDEVRGCVRASGGVCYGYGMRACVCSARPLLRCVRSSRGPLQRPCGGRVELRSSGAPASAYYTRDASIFCPRCKHMEPVMQAYEARDAST
jgi:hypothetical protein